MGERAGVDGKAGPPPQARGRTGLVSLPPPPRPLRKRGSRRFPADDQVTDPCVDRFSSSAVPRRVDVGRPSRRRPPRPTLLGAARAGCTSRTKTSTSPTAALPRLAPFVVAPRRRRRPLARTRPTRPTTACRPTTRPRRARPAVAKASAGPTTHSAPPRTPSTARRPAGAAPMTTTTSPRPGQASSRTRTGLVAGPVNRRSSDAATRPVAA